MNKQDINETSDDDFDNIRPPDQVTTDTLCPNLYYFGNDNDNDLSDDELNKMIEFSKLEFDLLVAEEEQKLIKIIKAEANERLQKFESIKQKIKKLAIYDKSKTNIYDNILSIVELYENGFVTSYTLTKEEYTQIFAILNSVRITDSEMESLRTLFVSEDAMN